MLSLSTFVTRLSWLPAARSKAQFTCRAACWSSVPTPKAHTTIPLLGRKRPPSSIAHQAGARRSPEKRCKSLESRARQEQAENGDKIDAAIRVKTTTLSIAYTLAEV